MIQVGFLRFLLIEGRVQLHRAGCFFGGEKQKIAPPSACGFFRVRTSNAWYDGPELKPGKVENSADKLLFTLESPDGGFEIESRWSCDPVSGIVSRKDLFRARKDLTLLRFDSTLVLDSNDYELYFQQSRWGLENQGAWNALPAGALELSSRRGRWTEGGTPFAGIRSADSPQALVFHLLPNGDCHLKFSRPVFSTQKPVLLCETGPVPDQLAVPLKPGETFAAPEILLQLLPDREIFSGTAQLHEYAYTHFVPEQKELPVVYNTWLNRMSELKLPELRRQLAAAKKAGCEVFVIDSGWYIAKGDWVEAQDKGFAGKMAEFREEVRKAGLKFGIWIEPEFFKQDAPVVQEHPEWFELAEQSGFLRMNFRTPEAKEHYYGIFARLIRTWQLDYIKIDMNASPGRDPLGTELQHYVSSIREIMLRIRKDFPETVLENCSSGAMRTTLAELPYFDQHFISDNANVLDVLHITQGMLLRFPPGRLLRWFTVASSGAFHPWPQLKKECVLQPQNATWKHFEETDLDCGLLASMTGVFGFSGDLASLCDGTLAEIRTYTDFYKQNRYSLQRARAVLLTGPDPIDRRHGVIAFELSDPETDRHYVFTFYRDCDGSAGRIFYPPDLDLCKMYCAAPALGETAGAQSLTLTGGELAQDGLEIPFICEQHGDFKGVLWTIFPA